MLKLLTLSALISGTSILVAVDLKPGVAAPQFEAVDQNGRTVRLADFQGKAVVVLYFYPKDDTPGCTAEACSLRDGYANISQASAVVLGVSADDEKSHSAFAAKYNLPFSILADTSHKIIEDYGVKMPMVGMARRWTFIIDKSGVIRYVISDVKPKEHDQQVLGLLKGLQ
jgi:peroxiredoxin Q/BCP